MTATKLKNCSRGLYLTFRVAEARKREGARLVNKIRTLPHPFKCSKCNYIAKNRTDFNDHWTLEH